MQEKMNEDLQHQLFKMYSKNLERVTELLKTSDYHQVLVDTYLCPICERLFTQDHLNINLREHLTIEHVPPSTVGWKRKVLTCKRCNNGQGGQFDSQIKKLLNGKAFKLKVPGTRIDARATYKGHSTNGIAEITSDGEAIFHIDESRSNPISIPVLREAFKSDPESIGLIIRQGKMKNALISMIRAAYLWGFAEFGYAFTFNPNLEIVRQQLLKPKEDLYFSKYVLSGTFPAEWQGMHLVEKPEGAEGYAFIMNFVGERVTEELCVLLPGADRQAFTRLNFLREEITRERPSLDLQPVQDPDYLTHEDRCLYMLMYWLEKYEFINDAED